MSGQLTHTYLVWLQGDLSSFVMNVIYFSDWVSSLMMMSMTLFELNLWCLFSSPKIGYGGVGLIVPELMC